MNGSRVSFRYLSLYSNEISFMPANNMPFVGMNSTSLVVTTWIVANKFKAGGTQVARM